MELGFPLEIEFLDREPKALLDIKNTLFANLPQVNAALTAPSTHHMQNYERLEIYGDTVISLLVVLEIYVLRNQMDTQNELDI
jgi:dsRNA-specific ribonuclease